jgi:hypothetical protein
MPKIGLVVWSLLLAAGFTLLFLVSPAAFYWLSLEVDLVESLSALFCQSGATFPSSSLGSRGIGRQGRRVAV